MVRLLPAVEEPARAGRDQGHRGRHRAGSGLGGVCDVRQRRQPDGPHRCPPERDGADKPVGGADPGAPPRTHHRMMETESDQTPEAGDSRRNRHEHYRSDEPAGWPSDPSGPRVASRPRGPGSGSQRPDGHRQQRPDSYRPRPDGYDQQRPHDYGRPQPDDYGRPQQDGSGRPRPDGYDQQQPDSYRPRADGYGRPRPDGYDQQRPDGYSRPQQDGSGRPRPGGYGRPEQDGYDQRPDGYSGRHSQAPVTTDRQRRPSGEGTRGDGDGQYRLADPPVARRTPTGWRVGDEEVSDLTSAMVLADLLAADLPAEGPPTPGGQAASAAARRRAEEPPPNVRQLQETVAQLEHALTVRVRVEQAIGVLAERYRMRPRQAFELLRSAARSRGRRVLEVAGEVVDSASNPLLRLPEELAKPPVIRRGRRMPRRPHVDD